MTVRSGMHGNMDPVHEAVMDGCSETLLRSPAAAHTPLSAAAESVWLKKKETISQALTLVLAAHPGA